MKHQHQSQRRTATPSPGDGAPAAPAIGIDRTDIAAIVKLCPTNAVNRRTRSYVVGQVPVSAQRRTPTLLVMRYG